ncbi:MAG: histidine kinase dimerization/phospho-acceptor domain-containing protein, partial [Pseudomonadota bacterium]
MNQALNYLNRVIDQFVPQHMKDDIAAEKRVRMFLISHLLGPFLGHPITIFLLATDPDPFPHVHILGLSITLFWTFPILLKVWPKKYAILAFLSVQNLSFAILWGSYHYGGAQSPFLMWYLVLPLLAFFYLGSGLKTSVAIFAQCTIGLLIFAGVHFIGGPPPLHIPLSEMGHVSLISAFCASIYVFFMASYYATVVDSQSEFLKEIARHQETLKQLTEAKEDAERANGAKSDFLAKMSHELRTPLNAVLGYSEILLEDAELDGRGEDIADLQKISAAGKHLLSMVNDILDISKIEAGKTDLYLETFDLGELVDEIESTSRPLAAKNTNKFMVERDEQLGEVHLDVTKLRQAVYNLLSNAS